MKRILAIVLIAAAMRPMPASAQEAATQTTEDPLAPFAWMDGRWRGEARVTTREGPVAITQTERSGELLGGRLRLVEGKGYDEDGSVVFNALGVIAAAAGGGYEMRSWTLEQAGGFPIAVEEHGFRWEIPAGPATIRYRATFANGVWTEIGERVVEGRPPMEVFRMELRRIGDTDWPAGGGLAAS